MGESTNACATLRFDRRIRLEFRGATITSDAGPCSSWRALVNRRRSQALT